MRELPDPFASLNPHQVARKAPMRSSMQASVKAIQARIAPLQQMLRARMAHLPLPRKHQQMQKQAQPRVDQCIQTPVESAKASPIQLSWARHQDEVAEAQRLRYKVFAEEMGARLNTPVAGLDIDLYDLYCEHLLIRDSATLEVIGTYRVLPPHKALEVGCLYSDSEFDLVRLRNLRHKMVEVGRSCVHADYRSGGVIMALWGGLGQYMQQHGYEIMLGCASVPMADGGHYAASLARILSSKHLTEAAYRVFPRLPLPIDALNSSLEVEPPPLLKGYMRIGAKICGAPAWDPDFNTADFLTMLQLSDINPRYAKHFLG
jgi:putative hemolysin